MVNHGPYAGFKTGKEAVDAQPKTGVSVIIVGAGIGGLTAATEMMMNGHGPVTVFESVPKFARLGDTIGIMPNAGRIIGRWPNLFDTLDPLCGHSPGIKILRWDGKFLADQTYPQGVKPRDQETEEDRKARLAFQERRKLSPDFDAHRGDLHQTLLDYAISVGVQVKQGVQVTEYQENDSEAWVVADGQKYTADVVIGADGVKSKARQIVLGYEDKPKSSGYAIYRAFFDGDLIRANPVCAHLVKDRMDQRNVWIGKDVHFIGAGVRNTEEFSWVMTHRDFADVTESWTAPGRVEDALRVAAEFDPVVKAVISCTPPDRILDWKLVYRDPLPTWVSKGGRVCLLGDAAHPFLPTSIQGASQAMEDGTTLAHTLKIAGKGDIPMATRVFQELRYERVKSTQKLGEQVRERWHRPRDWDNIEPDSVKLLHSPELFAHDASQYADDHYAEAAAKIRANGVKPAVENAQPNKDGLPPVVLGGSAVPVQVA